jgi:hypothetical protein
MSRTSGEQHDFCDGHNIGKVMDNLCDWRDKNSCGGDDKTHVMGKTLAL